MFMDKKFVEKFNHNAECYNFYGDVREEISVDALQAYRNLGEITALPYDNHAGVWLTRWSHTRILIFPNDSHIVCYLKKQETIESSTFGSEVVAFFILPRYCKGCLVQVVDDVRATFWSGYYC